MKRKDVLVQIEIPKKFAADVDETAEMLGITRTAMTRIALFEFCQRVNPDEIKKENDVPGQSGHSSQGKVSAPISFSGGSPYDDQRTV
jgi:hypothetical protein